MPSLTRYRNQTGISRFMNIGRSWKMQFMMVSNSISRKNSARSG